METLILTPVVILLLYLLIKRVGRVNTCPECGKLLLKNRPYGDYCSQECFDDATYELQRSYEDDEHNF